MMKIVIDQRHPTGSRAQYLPKYEITTWYEVENDLVTIDTAFTDLDLIHLLATKLDYAATSRGDIETIIRRDVRGAGVAQ